MIDLSDININLREDFVDLIDRLELKVGVEIGLGTGDNAIHLLENSSLEKLYSIDNWSVRNCRRHSQKTLKKMAKYESRFEFLNQVSAMAAEQFEDGFFDFIYIDGDHQFRGINADIRAFYPKLREGGFFGGHDYVKARRCGVVRAVNEFFKEIDREFYLTNESNENRINKSFWMIK